MTKIIKALMSYLLLLGIIISFWIFLHHGLKIPDYFLPGMSEVWHSLTDNHVLLFTNFIYSFLVAISGLTTAIVIALLLGFLCYLSPFLLNFFNPLVLISQALPMLAVAPLIILWLGIGFSSKLVVITISLFFPIFATFIEGLKHLDTSMLDLAFTMRAKKLRLFRFMIFPAILPQVTSGIKVSVTWSILSAIVAEWVGGSEGLGFVMQDALSRLDTPLLFAALILLVTGTLIFYAVVSISISCFSFKRNCA